MEIIEPDFKTATINIIYAQESKGNHENNCKKRENKEKQMGVVKMKSKISDMNI